MVNETNDLDIPHMDFGYYQSWNCCPGQSDTEDKL